MKLSAIRHANGKCYLIDTCRVLDGFETMVFAVDGDVKDEFAISYSNASVLDEKQVEVNWSDLYCIRYSSQKEAAEDFSRIVNNFQQFFDENIDDKEGDVVNV